MDFIALLRIGSHSVCIEQVRLQYLLATKPVVYATTLVHIILRTYAGQEFRVIDNGSSSLMTNSHSVECTKQFTTFN